MIRKQTLRNLIFSGLMGFALFSAVPASRAQQQQPKSNPGELTVDRIFRAPGAEISVELMKKVNAAVLAACDADDGVADGVLSKPYACKWDPAAMQCKAGADHASCLMPPQVKAIREAYQTTRTRAGVVGNYGLTRGSD